MIRRTLSTFCQARPSPLITDFPNSTLRNLRDEVLRPGVGEYPPFLYKDFTVDEDDLLEGLFMSDLLLKVCQLMSMPHLMLMYIIGCQAHTYRSQLSRFARNHKQVHSSWKRRTQRYERGDIAIHCLHLCSSELGTDLIAPPMTLTIALWPGTLRT